MPSHCGTDTPAIAHTGDHGPASSPSLRGLPEAELEARAQRLHNDILEQSDLLMMALLEREDLSRERDIRFEHLRLLCSLLSQDDLVNAPEFSEELGSIFEQVEAFQRRMREKKDEDSTVCVCLCVRVRVRARALVSCFAADPRVRPDTLSRS